MKVHQLKTIMKQFRMIALTAVPVSGFFEILQKYLIGDVEFIKYIVVLVGLDTILGFIKHLMHKDANSKDFFNEFAKKIFIYLALIILATVLYNVTANGSHVVPIEWISTFIYSMMIIREAVSIVENIQAIYPIFPAAIVKRLKDFRDNGEYIEKQTA